MRYLSVLLVSFIRWALVAISFSKASSLGSSAIVLGMWKPFWKFRKHVCESRKKSHFSASLPSSNIASGTISLGSHGLKLIVPPMLLFLLTLSECHASPLNPQPISIRGPFFQGWLVRSVDHERQCSFILIIGSFSSKGNDKYEEHYLFCGANTREGSWHVHDFPHPSQVTISGSKPSTPFPLTNSPFAQPTNITWAATGYGSFCFTEEECCADFRIKGVKVSFKSRLRLPWSKINSHSEGPEGLLGFTGLLPCHYWVHSVGSPCTYELDLPESERQHHHQHHYLEDTVLSKPSSIGQGHTNNNRRYHISGEAYSHIEGNHGTFFPSGWTWSQAVAEGNRGSLSLVAGRFQIGPLSPLSVVFFLRIGEKRWIFRTTELDRVKYRLDAIDGTVHMITTSASGSTRVDLKIAAAKPFERAFSPRIYVPTPEGFTNHPGCRETYTATATAICSAYNDQTKTYEETDRGIFPLTALEFGGLFQGQVIKNF